MAHELEREFKDLGRYDKTNLRVHEKTIATSVDRQGTVRVVNGIPALRPVERRMRSQISIPALRPVVLDNNRGAI